MKPSILWQWDRPLDRAPYATLGVVLFAIKHNLDRLVATVFFHRPWSPFNYLQPQATSSLHNPSLSETWFYATLVAIALPFIWIGVILTLRRLRATGLPLWLVALFFVPVVNLLFFAVMSVLPSRAGPETAEDLPAGKLRSVLNRVIPNNMLGSAAMTLLLMVALGLGGTLFSVELLKHYGAGLFVGLPFCVGLGSALLYSFHQRRSLLGCLVVSWIAVGLLGGTLIICAVEGALCLIMALPLGLVLATLGALIGYVIQRSCWGRNETLSILLALTMALPAMMGAESRTQEAPTLIPIRTSVDIDAPPEAVWHHVITFNDLPQPTDVLFKLGVAYPMQARIWGHGVGAVRHCIFSTGPFVEPITVWNEPRLLKFSVAAQPPAMREWSPYPGLKPPHIDDYLLSEGGQFLLTPLPGNRTRLEGTTWYRHKIWPAAYWRIWSDEIIHRIHLRVLTHIKTTTERDQATLLPVIRIAESQEKSAQPL